MRASRGSMGAAYASAAFAPPPAPAASIVAASADIEAGRVGVAESVANAAAAPPPSSTAECAPVSLRVGIEDGAATAEHLAAAALVGAGATAAAAAIVDTAAVAAAAEGVAGAAQRVADSSLQPRGPYRDRVPSTSAGAWGASGRTIAGARPPVSTDLHSGRTSVIDQKAVLGGPLATSAYWKTKHDTVTFQSGRRGTAPVPSRRVG